MIDLAQPAIQRVVDAASRRGVALDIRLIRNYLDTAEAAAAAVKAELGQIVTSLVFVAPRPNGKLAPVVCLVSGRNQVDTARLAAAAGEVSFRAATADEALKLTGYAIGRIPPFGHSREVKTLMDRDLCVYPWVWAAAGSSAAVFRVAPRTLRALSNAVVAPVAEKPWMPSRAAQIGPRLWLGVGAGA